MTRRPTHRASHHALLRDTSAETLSRAFVRKEPLHAIIVPTDRLATSLRSVIRLSADLQVPLVVLCSHQARADQVEVRIAAEFGARGFAIQVPDDYELDLAPTRTSDPCYRDASYGRRSDLSLKRNLGLLIARMRGWHKVLFLDDDIRGLRSDDIKRLEAKLDHEPIAGMICRDYPDNSVVCHARRLAGLSQGNFVSGAVLGVNCADHPLGFFPDIYNEDWFFFARSAAKQELPAIGEAGQLEYDPYADVTRARREEFGDLLAEGLYRLFGNEPGRTIHEHVEKSGVSGWEQLIEDRRATITHTLQAMRTKIDKDERHDLPMHAAIKSLYAAEEQYSDWKISADLCLSFLHDWLDDLHDWSTAAGKINTVVPDARMFDELGLSQWRSIRMEQRIARYV